MWGLSRLMEANLQSPLSHPGQCATSLEPMKRITHPLDAESEKKASPPPQQPERSDVTTTSWPTPHRRLLRLRSNDYYQGGDANGPRPVLKDAEVDELNRSVAADAAKYLQDDDDDNSLLAETDAKKSTVNTPAEAKNTSENESADAKKETNNSPSFGENLPKRRGFLLRLSPRRHLSAGSLRERTASVASVSSTESSSQGASFITPTTSTTTTSPASNETPGSITTTLLPAAPLVATSDHDKPTDPTPMLAYAALKRDATADGPPSQVEFITDSLHTALVPEIDARDLQSINANDADDNDDNVHKNNDDDQIDHGLDSQDDPFASATQTLTSQIMEHYHRAVALAATDSLDDALEEVHAGLCLCEEHDDDDTLYSKFCMVEAGILGRKGEVAASLAIYQQVLDRYLLSDPSHVEMAEMANLCYACGRLCCHLRDFGRALEYHQQELAFTEQVFGAEHPAVGRICHELARLCRQGLGDLDQALGYYRHALSIEVAVWKATREEAHGHCLAGPAGRLCPDHAGALREAVHQIQETKKCLGRIHYEQGDFQQAIRLTVLPMAGV